MRPAISPEQILANITGSDHAALILRRICASNPKPVTRKVLMDGAGISVEREGPISAYAAFYWYIERVNDELRRLGWRIADHGGDHFFLVRR